MDELWSIGWVRECMCCLECQMHGWMDGVRPALHMGCVWLQGCMWMRVWSAGRVDACGAIVSCPVYAVSARSFPLCIEKHQQEKDLAAFGGDADASVLAGWFAIEALVATGAASASGAAAAAQPTSRTSLGSAAMPAMP